MQHIVTANDLRPGIRKQWECVAAPLRLSPVNLRWIDANPDDSNTSCIEFPKLLLKTPQLGRSEEHTSELQSRFDLVCRLLLEKKKEMEAPAKLTSDLCAGARWCTSA